MATNVLSVYDPYFYANEGLIALEAPCSKREQLFYL